MRVRYCPYCGGLIRHEIAPTCRFCLDLPNLEGRELELLMRLEDRAVDRALDRLVRA